jgi:hypothetical protein
MEMELEQVDMRMLIKWSNPPGLFGLYFGSVKYRQKYPVEQILYEMCLILNANSDHSRYDLRSA